MQCNDYFYSRYFGSPFTLSGMTPHWPTDYLCGCCHTWLLQLGSLSTITPSESSLFYYWTFICFSLYHCKSLPIFQRLNFYFLWSFPLLQRLHHLLISFSHQSLYWFSSTFSNFSFLLALIRGSMKILEGFCKSVLRSWWTNYYYLTYIYYSYGNTIKTVWNNNKIYGFNGIKSTDYDLKGGKSCPPCELVPCTPSPWKLELAVNPCC